MKDDPHSELSELTSIKAKAFKLLKKNPLLKAKSLCKLLDLPYSKYKSYMDNIRHEWKSSLQFGLGSKPDSFHHARAWVYVDRLNLNRQDALERGWIQSRNRNRALIWKDPLGRIEWFETGRCNIYVKAPPLKGRLWQLFCNAFSFTGLIDSMQILEKMLKAIRTKGATAVWETGSRLPYISIDLFRLSNGIKIKMGDLSHPSGIEVEFAYPDWAEKNERLLGEIFRLMKGEPPSRLKPEDKESYVS